ncbi:MAG: ABC transporter permease, partial [Pseudomonadales bacterium]|nr:ABC transporter permease [Pseudomonadales bacterium]
MQLLSNINYSIRLLRKTPGFTIATLVVLVLGLSLYLTSYTFVRILSDKPMPFVNGDRYVTLKTINSNIGDFDYSQDAYDYYAFNRIKERSTSYTILGAFNPDSFVFSDGGYAQRFAGASISTDLFTALEVNPSQGRLFDDLDADSNSGRVAVISHALWQSYYGGDSGIVGQSSSINGEPHTVIGIMPEGFKFPTHHDVWFPLPNQDSAIPGEGERLTLAGILEDDSTLVEAEAELNAILQELSIEYPDVYANRSEIVRYYAASTSPDTNGFNQILLYTTLIILTLGVVNLSSLLLIRSASRRQELAIRSSLGANGWELAKQVLLESSLICTFGLLLSFGLTSLLLPLMHIQFQSSQDVPLPFWFDFQIDGNVMLAGIVCTALIWLASSLFVALRVYKEKPAEVLSGTSNKGTGGSGKSWITQIVVSAEVTLSCFLLVCCGMVVYFAYQVTNTDYGL